MRDKCRRLPVHLTYLITMSAYNNNDLNVRHFDENTGKKYLALHYAKLVFWLVSFVVILVFVGLYTNDMRQRIDKNWHVLNELQIVNRRLSKENDVLKNKIVYLEKELMQKNFRITTLERTIAELRNRRELS